MFDIDFFQEIWQTITRNKARSVFTAFGVFWGVFMLVVMVGLGSSLSSSLMEGIDIVPNSGFFFTNTTSEPYKGFREGRSWNMSVSDLDAVKAQFGDEILYTAPILFAGRGGSSDNVFYGSRSSSGNVMGYGCDMQLIAPNRILQGRGMNRIDELEARKVCSIGKKVYDNLFKPGENPIGTLIKVQGVYYSVIGVHEQASDKVQIFGDASNIVLVPYTTLQIMNNRGDKIDALALAAKSNVEIKDLQERIGKVIKQRNMVSPTDPTGLVSFDLKEMFDMFRMLSGGLQILIWIVGLGTLLSGIVGVSNIMLITVRERTQEIGVRRALGATPGSILRQVMSESVLLTSLAGITGFVAAVGAMSAASSVLRTAKPDSFISTIQIPFNTSIAAICVIILFGLLAGWLPSKRALSIKAVEALQEE